MSMLDVALAAAREGFSVFALGVRSKMPATEHGCNDATRDEDEIRAQWSEPRRNIAIATGDRSGVFVVDIDGDEGAKSFAEWEATYGPLPATVTARTRNGWHFYFRNVAGVRNSASKIAKNIDVRGDGGYVVCPPSEHPDGGSYAWAEGSSPSQVDVADAPAWLLKLILDKPKPVFEPMPARSHTGATKYGQHALDAECMELARHPEGGRNAKLNAVAFRVGQLVARGHLDEAPSVADLTHSAKACGLDPVETRKTIASGMAAGMKSPNPNDPNPDELRTRSVSRSAGAANDNAPANGEPVDPQQRDREAEKKKDELPILDAPTVVAHALVHLRDTSSIALPRSGYARLDAAIGGLPPGTMLTVGGRTGGGKSSLLLGMALNMAGPREKGSGHKVGIISCEDAEWIWGARICASIANIAQDRFFQPEFAGPMSKQEAQGAIDEAKKYGVHFAFCVGKTVDVVTAAMHRLVKEFGCSVIMVDYLQAIMARGKDRYLARTDDAQQMKGTAHDLGVALVLASQLKRPEGDNAFKEPTARDLKDSGDIENMSEALVLLWPTSDAEYAPVHGKVGKVKWSPRRPLFTVERNPETGALTGLGDRHAPLPPSAPEEYRSMSNFNRRRPS